jgi:alkanesulfonate monooxygenase SsuD/methylene tetrahydromethanopterin reductase-like flavin-dependent oxidoreductase (luciferase family)
MRLGVALPFTAPGGGPLGPRDLADAAAAIERNGFDSAWVFDAIGRGFMLPDPLTALSVAATVTERIELGTGVMQVPLRRTVELANRVLTTQLLAGGRFLFGVGAGSTAADFAAIDVPFERRHAVLAEMLAAMRRLWAGEEVDGIALSPWPAVVGGPPVLIGAWLSPNWIGRAADEFDGWIGSAAKTNLATLRTGVARFRDAGGRRAVVTNIAVDLDADAPAPADDEPFHLRCDPDEAAARLQALAELGFDDAVLVPADHSDASLARLRELLAAAAVRA